MSAAIAGPLHALSLARTALDDPNALPSAISVDRSGRVAPGTQIAEVAYAIAQIDHAIGGLYFEPFADPAAEANLALTNLGQLLASVADGLDECGGYDGAAAKTRDAVAQVSTARVLLAPATS